VRIDDLLLCCSAALHTHSSVVSLLDTNDHALGDLLHFVHWRSGVAVSCPVFSNPKPKRHAHFRNSYDTLFIRKLSACFLRVLVQKLFCLVDFCRKVRTTAAIRMIEKDELPVLFSQDIFRQTTFSRSNQLVSLLVAADRVW